MTRTYRYCAAVLLAAFAAGATAAAPDAQLFYEDAVRRFEKSDLPGASIQLKTALQHDRSLLAAHVLLGKTLLRSGDLRGAEAAFGEAQKRGVSTSDIALPLAQLYLGLGRPDLVIERLVPSSAPAEAKADVLSLIGTAYLELGQARRADEAFEEARRSNPKSASPFIAECSALLRGGLVARARPLAERATALAPANADAWNLYAAVLHATSDHQAALTAYTRALSIEPRHVDARVARAALLIDLNRTAAAEEDLRFLQDSARGEPRAAYLRAVVASRSGNDKAAMTALQEVVKLIGQLSPAWLRQQEQLLMLAALAHQGLHQSEQARGYATQLVARNDRNIGAKKLLASIYISLGDYKSAAAHLDPLHKAAPHDPEVLLMVGTTSLASGNYARAAELLEKATRSTKSGEATRLLGVSQVHLGRVELGTVTLEKALAEQGLDLQAARMLSLLYVRRGQLQKAIRLAENMAAREPANAAVLNFVGTVKAAVGDMPGAQTTYLRVASLHPDYIPAQLNLAKLKLDQREIGQARRLLHVLLAKQPDSSDVLLHLALTDEADGNIEQALRHLHRAVDLQSRDALPGIALVDLYLRQYRPQEALSVASDLSSRFPRNVDVQLARAGVLMALGDLRGARDIAREATANAGSNPDHHLRIARSLLAAANPQAAHHSVQKSLQMRPDDPDALALMVEVERQRSGARGAEAALAELRRKHPNSTQAALAEGDLAAARNEPARAISAYRLAWSREESTTNAVHVSRAYLLSGDTVNAAAFLHNWASKRPQDVRAQAALAEIQFRSGQLAASRQTYARVLNVIKNDPAVLNNFANLIHRMGDPNARSYAERAVSITPNNPHYADTLGWILAQQGEITAGLRFLRQARLSMPSNPEIRFHLAFALAKASQVAEARSELGDALRAVPPLENSSELVLLRQQLGM
jgi:putative PEP-CTERM system TPR-repeat lipoprotein